MNKFSLKTIVLGSFLIIPSIIFLVPDIKDITIACAEFLSESWLLSRLIILCIKPKNKPHPG